jgi:hypothetical protein
MPLAVHGFQLWGHETPLLTEGAVGGQQLTLQHCLLLLLLLLCCCCCLQDFGVVGDGVADASQSVLVTVAGCQ